jgi:hypothetical protein
MDKGLKIQEIIGYLEQIQEKFFFLKFINFSDSDHYQQNEYFAKIPSAALRNLSCPLLNLSFLLRLWRIGITEK